MSAASSTVRKVKRKADEARQETMRAEWTSYVGRAGLVARGVIYSVVGILALRIAFGAGDGEEADKDGAFEVLSRHPLGRVGLAVLAGGFACYAAWRLVEAVLDPERRGPWKRVGSGARAVLYGSFFLTAMSYVFRDKEAHDKDQEHQDQTARILEWPAGRLLVGALALALLGAGVWNAYRAVSGKYQDHLKKGEIDTDERPWIVAVACAGLAARAVVFSAIGFFVLKTAWQADPDDTVGLDGSLRRLADEPAGPLMLSIVAAGLIAYGLWSFVEARFRKLLGD
ncbi:MAG TPA: DUF1206 domain-containing protein [Mycobacteriales bacterium]|nr:DUF1206 domain-containing protein [Mycobacteriales bacterium]